MTESEKAHFDPRAIYDRILAALAKGVPRGLAAGSTRLTCGDVVVRHRWEGSVSVIEAEGPDRRGVVLARLPGGTVHVLRGQVGPWLDAVGRPSTARFHPSSAGTAKFCISLLGLCLAEGEPVRGRRDVIRVARGPVGIAATRFPDHVTVSVSVRRKVVMLGALRSRRGAWDHRAGYAVGGDWLRVVAACLPDPATVLPSSVEAWRPGSVRS